MTKKQWFLTLVICSHCVHSPISNRIILLSWMVLLWFFPKYFVMSDNWGLFTPLCLFILCFGCCVNTVKILEDKHLLNDRGRGFLTRSLSPPQPHKHLAATAPSPFLITDVIAWIMYVSTLFLRRRRTQGWEGSQRWGDVFPPHLHDRYYWFWEDLQCSIKEGLLWLSGLHTAKQHCLQTLNAAINEGIVPRDIGVSLLLMPGWMKSTHRSHELRMWGERKRRHVCRRVSYLGTCKL